MEIINEDTLQRLNKRICKTKKEHTSLEGEENPNIYVILVYKTPPITIEWILIIQFLDYSV